MSSSSVAEMRQWLSSAKLSSSTIQSLVEDHGYDDLSVLKRALPVEIDELLGLVVNADERSRLRALLNPRPGLRLEELLSAHNEGYLSVLYDGEWADKWCVLDGGLLSWKRAKKAAEFEVSVNLLISVAERIGARVMVQSPEGIQYGFECENETETVEWFPGL
jgi:hypothetical protein